MPKRPVDQSSLWAIGAGGVRLRVRTAGPREAPAVVFIHGWSQSLEAWDDQFASELVERFRLVAYDLRGHGRSDAPAGAEHYRPGTVWADDLATVIEAGCHPQRPVVLVAWSYGGFVVIDHLTHRGADRLAGICFVAASVNLDDDQVPRYLAPVFPPLAERAGSPDPAEADAAIAEFVALCPARPLDLHRHEAIVRANRLTRPDVRAALGDRRVAGDEVLAGLAVPVLVVQGLDDPIVLPATADHIAAVCPTAELLTYPGVGHVPMVEAGARFTADLITFVERCAGPG